MPIVEIEIVGELAGREGLAQRLADSLGGVLGSTPGRAWVRVRSLPADDYAENEGSGGILPVFVKVIERTSVDADRLGEQLEKITEVVASITGRPRENVHVIYEPAATGRVAFGGKLLS